VSDVQGDGGGAFVSPSRFVVWHDVGREVQFAQWREALETAGGNIMRAGRSMGFKKDWAMKLTRRHGLNEYARELRKAAGARGEKATGRPVEKG
jgi:hypothetical protein